MSETVKIENEQGEWREYETVASRLMRFRADHPDHSIVPELIDVTEEVVRMKVVIGFMFEGNYHVLSVGHAEEYRGASKINRTSAMENCETSAVGRALAWAGYGSANSIATREEVEGAKEKEAVMDAKQAGLVARLQDAADAGGSKRLRYEWETAMSEEERITVGGKTLAVLKRRATKVDKDKAEAAGT